MKPDLEKLKSEQVEKLQKAEREIAIYDALAALGCAEPRQVCIFAHSAKREAGAWITWGDDFKSEPITPDEFLHLAQSLPSLPMMRWNDGCAGVQSREFRETIAKEYKNEAEIAPFWCEVQSRGDGFGGATCVHWLTEIAGEVVRVSVVLSMAQVRKCCRVEYRRSEHQGGYEYKDCRTIVGDSMYMIKNADGVQVAESGGPGVWLVGRGSHNVANGAYFTWTPIDADREPTVSDFVRQLLAPVEVATN